MQHSDNQKTKGATQKVCIVMHAKMR